MADIRFMDFDLEVVPEAAGHRANVLSAPVGAGSSATLAGIDAAEISDLYQHLATARDAIRVHDVGPTIRDILDRTRRFGGGLFGSLFTDGVGESLRGSLRESARRSLGLRVRLRIPPDLGDVPWEYLYHEELDRFLCLSTQTPVVRYLETVEPVRVVHVQRPLRILVMVSSPSDHPPLQVQEEYSRLQTALGELISDGTVALDRVEPATIVALHDRLLGDDCHVFHFIGHGGFDPARGDGVLVLQRPDGTGELVPGDDLGTVLHDHRPLRLAILNSCEGARGSRTDPFAGTAQGLIQQRVPAVIAMQFPISDVAATTFAENFYRALAHGYPVDAALGEARKVIYLSGNRLEWATPVLYMRTANGRIFDVEGAAPLERRAVEVDPLATTKGDESLEVAPAAVVVDGKQLEVGGPHGAVIDTATDATPEPRLRHPPLDLRPKDFPELLGRMTDVHRLTSAFLTDAGTATEPVEVSGQAGAGKTALLRNVAHHPAAQFPSGVVYSASPQPAPDLLRFLFQTFFETPRPFMPSEADLRRFLHDVEALIELDDVALTRDDVEYVTNVVPNCLFVLASERRVLFEGGPAIALRGLEEPAALQLLERRLGRPIHDAELPAARRLVAVVDGMPLLIAQAAARIADGGTSIEAAAGEASGRPTDGRLAVELTLSEPERRLLAVLAAARAPVDIELLIAATGLPDTGDVLESLKRRGLVQSYSPRYSLATALPVGVLDELEATQWQDRALDAFVAWAEARVETPYRVLEEADALLGILRWAEDEQAWSRVVRLGRALERSLALAARWSRWQEVLAAVLRAARSAGDRMAEAWALHQQGSRLVCLETIGEGRALLEEALEVREAIGDEAGAEITRHNLEFTGWTPPTPKPGPGPTPPPRRWWLRLLVIVAIIGLGATAAVLLWPGPVDEIASLAFVPDALSFRDQTLDTPSTPETVTLESTGGLPVQIRRVRILPDETEFSLGANTCVSARLDEGARCTIQVVFRPRDEGTRSATLVIAHDGEGGRIEIPLSGDGLPEDGVTTPPQIPEIDVQPEGGLVFEDTGQREVVTISSVGSAPLEISSTAIDPAELEGTQYAVELETDRPCLSVLDPGNGCSVWVTFLGDPELDSTATLLIDSNAGDVPVAIPLSGVPVPVITPGEWAFDEADDRWELTFAVENAGTAPFEVLDAFTEDPYDPDVFLVVDRPCGVVGIGGSCTITISETTACVTDTFEGTLVIDDTTPDGRHSAPFTYPRVCVE